MSLYVLTPQEGGGEACTTGLRPKVEFVLTVNVPAS